MERAQQTSWNLIGSLSLASGAQARPLSSSGNLDKPGASAASSVEWERKLPLPFGAHAA